MQLQMSEVYQLKLVVWPFKAKGFFDSFLNKVLCLNLVFEINATKQLVTVVKQTSNAIIR